MRDEKFGDIALVRVAEEQAQHLHSTTVWLTVLLWINIKLWLGELEVDEPVCDQKSEVS